MTWNDASHTLDMPQMDATHREFLALLADAVQAADADFLARFDALLEHTQRHFDSEGVLMRACNFPAIAEHEGDHRRILGELADARCDVAAGRLDAARHYAEVVLPDWFAFHLATMDTCLAATLKRAAAG
ncbi:MAG: hemerythrin domain-containing protein [Rhodocyclales bacterium]|nr:hemerythrin domain-containing protein [Rhodocyclales bacterium]